MSANILEEQHSLLQMDGPDKCGKNEHIQLLQHFKRDGDNKLLPRQVLSVPGRNTLIVTDAADARLSILYVCVHCQKMISGPSMSKHLSSGQGTRCKDYYEGQESQQLATVAASQADAAAAAAAAAEEGAATEEGATDSTSAATKKKSSKKKKALPPPRAKSTRKKSKKLNK